MDRDEQQANPLIKALVVDDSTTLRRLMELILVPLGIDIDFVDTGERAVDISKRKTYDIVFLDILLPGIDGYRVCKTIKGDKRSKETRVVMLTSQNSAIDKVRGMMAGADVYLTKPVDRLDLLRAIDKCLPRAEVSQSSVRLAANTRR
ncbi:MAG: PleD family two-component system response regulator [Sulfurifustis sp.]